MDREKEKRKLKRQDFMRSLCFLSPSLIGVGVFFIVPFGVVVYYSMIDGVGSRNFVFLENFIKLFNNSAFIMAAKKYLAVFCNSGASCGNTFYCAGAHA